MQGEHWIKYATYCQILNFVDTLGRKKYSFLKQCEQMMPEPLQSIPAFAVSARRMQIFMSSNSNKKSNGFHDVNLILF